MAKKPLKLLVREEQSLLAVGRDEGITFDQEGVTLQGLDGLQRKGLVFCKEKKDPRTGLFTGWGHFLTSEGFFIWKQLERGKSFTRTKRKEEA